MPGMVVALGDGEMHGKREDYGRKIRLEPEPTAILYPPFLQSLHVAVSQQLSQAREKRTVPSDMTRVPSSLYSLQQRLQSPQSPPTAWWVQRRGHRGHGNHKGFCARPRKSKKINSKKPALTLQMPRHPQQTGAASSVSQTEAAHVPRESRTS